MTVTFAVTQEARTVARRFMEAFNARDLDVLRTLVTDDVELRPLTGETLRGIDGARALLDAAEDLDLRLVPLRAGTVEDDGGRIRVSVPARELIGPDDIERVLEFEIRDGRVAAFAVRTLE
jgi:limonene-1,2-epoxide hydrolase